MCALSSRQLHIDSQRKAAKQAQACQADKIGDTVTLPIPHGLG